MNREQYHFSPWDSAHLSYLAAKAAATFQPTHSRLDAQRALPFLEKYYTLIQRQTGERFDARKVAELELGWWQLRRENSKPGDYGEVIAKIAIEIYGIRNDAIREGGRLRAAMMHYRDEHGQGVMQLADWSHIEEGLSRSYSMLKQSISNASAEMKNRTKISP